MADVYSIKETPEADPFVVGLAKAGTDAGASSLIPDRYIVVSEERRRAIPQACSKYGIECINLLEVFRREGWKFPVTRRAPLTRVT